MDRKKFIHAMDQTLLKTEAKCPEMDFAYTLKPYADGTLFRGDGKGKGFARIEMKMTFKEGS